MFKTTSIILATSLALPPLSLSTPARAGGEGVAAGIIGFAAGAFVGSQLSKQRPVYNTRRSARSAPARAPARTAEERQYWKSVQASLNQLGYNAGPVDGAPGRRTRAAIAQFQMTINAEPNGKLTADQAAILFANTNPSSVPMYQPDGTTIANGQYPLAPGMAPAYGAIPGQPPNYAGAPAGAAQQPFAYSPGYGPTQQATFPSIAIPGGGPGPATAPGGSYSAPATAKFPAVADPSGGGVIGATQQFQAPVQQTIIPPGTGSGTYPLVNGEAAGTSPVAPVAGQGNFFPALARPAGNDPTPVAPATQNAAASVEQNQQPPGSENRMGQDSLPQTNVGGATQQPQPPQLSVQADENGNLFVVVNGQRFYLNAGPQAPSGNPQVGEVLKAESTEVPQQ